MLTDALRHRLGAGSLASFQLMGEELALVTGEDLSRAADAWRSELARLPTELRARFVAAQTRVQTDAHAFLRKYNRSVHTRVAGYVELARRVELAYPWPVVAILGIDQVRTGIRYNRVYGLVGSVVERVYAALGRVADGADDVLRRTNRGIFADSAPTVLYGLTAAAARASGDRELADALLAGPLPPFMDDECAYIARELANGLAIADADARFAALAQLTHRHFAREQAIFTHHIGQARGGKRIGVLERVSTIDHVPAPVIARGRRGARIELRPFALPRGFDMRDHDARVAAFSRAFVSSITGSRDDYGIAARHVLQRYGRRDDLKRAT